MPVLRGSGWAIVCLGQAAVLELGCRKCERELEEGEASADTNNTSGKSAQRPSQGLGDKEAARILKPNGDSA